ncbi:MAG: TetR/AcrR family transcriptional regulator [Candidatus Pelethousia sp.]|nr:TetR/AcrR family transcriptional regulator [Candidatus Pelethousia sp.]
MDNKDFKTKIKEVAVYHFDQNGYYGTTIRKIAGDVGCSLPMIYYYYKSKKELFHEIVEKDFFAIVSRQAERAASKNIIDLYTEFVYELNHLNSYDRKVYRLCMKVYLGFDGDDELMAVMDQWEKMIVNRHLQLVLPHLKTQADGIVIVRTLIHLLENLIEGIVVKNRYLPKDEIREELSTILAEKIIK